MPEPARQSEQRTATLVMEVELPTMHVEDMHPDNSDWQRWLRDVGAEDGEAISNEVIGNIGEVNCGLLTVEVMGEKGGSTVERIPVNVLRARVEPRTPPDQHPTAERLAQDIEDEQAEARVLVEMDHAQLLVLVKFARLLAEEYTGQVADLAKQALQEAMMAMAEAEKRYAPDA